jgi:pimeloyl-ACP methyl ester carboxylesterase
MCLKTIGLLAGLLFASFQVLPAAEPPPGHTELVPVPTMGGKQLWSDELFFHQWRIQRNALTGHFRLLDKHNLRHAWGTFAACRAELERIKTRRGLPPMRGTVVIVMHGLIRSRESMNKLCKHLRKHGDWTVLNVAYPTTRRPVAEHAGSLARIIENLDGVDTIHFVGHSLGNIVIRHYLADRINRAGGGGKCDPRFGRMVMLGPPNHGSKVAASLSQNALFTIINGTPGKELGADWNKLKENLATPPMEFGIIAGGRRDQSGFNPLLPGDDDGTVSVRSTRLAGASDFVILPVMHSFMMDNEKVMQCTLRFLQSGYFISAEQRQPIKGNDEQE